MVTTNCAARQFMPQTIVKARRAAFLLAVFKERVYTSSYKFCTLAIRGRGLQPRCIPVDRFSSLCNTWSARAQAKSPFLPFRLTVNFLTSFFTGRRDLEEGRQRLVDTGGAQGTLEYATG
jgi:hypothetical protein